MTREKDDCLSPATFLNQDDYTYELEASDTGEKHTFECRDGIYKADGIEQSNPVVHCLMDATLDLLLQQAHMAEHLDALMGDCNSFADGANHPGSGRSH